MNFSVLSNSTSNNTDSGPSGQQWTLIPIVGVIVCIAALFTNGSALLAFALHRSQWTPFNVYLINLSLTNFVYAILQNPPDIINNLNTNWPLSFDYCTVYNYATNFLQAGMYNSHVLITIDRVWSMLFPVSYRNTRSVKTSMLTCLTMWVYIHIFILPGFIRDALYWRKPLDKYQCFINIDHQWEWAVMIQILLYNVPLATILCSYPLIWYKRHQRQKQTNLLLIGRTRVAPASVVNSSSHAHKKGQNAAEDESDEIQVKKLPNGKKASSTGFMVLTALTSSVFICWTPVTVYYTIGLFQTIESDLVYKIVTILFSVESVADPIWFMISMKSLRDAYFDLYKCFSHKK